MGLESMNTKYEVIEDFSKAQKALKEPWSVDINPYMDCFIQEVYLFRGYQLCIYIGSIKENSIRELHNEGL